jgi:hypothetical protein
VPVNGARRAPFANCRHGPTTKERRQRCRQQCEASAPAAAAGMIDCQDASSTVSCRFGPRRPISTLRDLAVVLRQVLELACRQGSIWGVVGTPVPSGRRQQEVLLIAQPISRQPSMLVNAEAKIVGERRHSGSETCRSPALSRGVGARMAALRVCDRFTD